MNQVLDLAVAAKQAVSGLSPTEFLMLLVLMLLAILVWAVQLLLRDQVRRGDEQHAVLLRLLGARRPRPRR